MLEDLKTSSIIAAYAFRLLRTNPSFHVSPQFNLYDGGCRLTIVPIFTCLSKHLRVYYELATWPATNWFDNSVSRALHRSRKGPGFETRSSLNFFRLQFLTALKAAKYEIQKPSTSRATYLKLAPLMPDEDKTLSGSLDLDLRI